MTISDIASLIIALGTVGSLLYISRQVNVNRLQAKGQFLLAIDAQFEKSFDIIRRLLSDKDFIPDGNDWPDVWRLMSVFERINIMIEDNILDIGLIDRLWGFVLIGLVANEEIYKRLQSTGVEWQDFIDLCYALANQRKKTRGSEHDAAFIKRVHTLSKQTQRVSNPFRF